MKLAAIEDVIGQLDELGIGAAPVRTGPNERPGFNVFRDGERMPVATVYVPLGGEGWVWGPAFEWGAGAGDDAATVAAKISRTIPR
jgi:hypothetical protein